ncbi:glycosyltransferase family 4 protein [Listeria floridensis]|uniref:glycosyltransferase family 4 protein n=1 Tax=Listeria floridensis TaxID=1494962 RepID=UPI0019D372BD|nr:glycosyltransferase family 4 protein [Listeria floridensis]
MIHFLKPQASEQKKRIQRELDHLDGLVVLSEEWAEFYQQLTITPIEIIENAVIVPDKPSYNSRATEIITLGRLGKRKGSYDILHMAKQIEAEFPDIHFTLFGDGEIEEVEQEMEALASQNVSLGGWLLKEEREKVMASTVLHLLPSYQEGLPMSILETMAEGIPNLASDVGGIPQVIQDNQNGMMVKPGDITEMTEKLRAFLNDKKLREEFSSAAYKKSKSRFFT